MKRTLYPILFLAACSAEDPTSAPAPSSDEPGPTTPIAAPDNEEQGRYLLSSIADGEMTNGDYFWVGTTGITTTSSVTTSETVSVEVIDGKLAATHANGDDFTDDEFDEMQLVGGTYPVKIDEVFVTDTGAVSYKLLYDKGQGWTDYCDAELSSEALPMLGRWTPTRDHYVGSNALTFACRRGGVAAKCIDWGYPPGNGGRGDPAWRLHQICTQHASAVYCNNGIARTRELTPIAIRDWISGAMPDVTDLPELPKLDPKVTWPPPDEFYVEGAWQFDGPVICLSKLRWTALPPGGFCSQDVPDPRDPYSPDEAVFCDDLTWAQMYSRGARFVTGSLVNDIVVNQWAGPAPDNELLSTVAGYVENGTPYSEPFTGYTLVMPQQRFIMLRNLPGSIDPIRDVTPVYFQYNKTTRDRVVAPVDAAGNGVTMGHVVDRSRPEGYLLKRQAPNGSLVLLKLFNKGDDFVTALVRPPGYNWVRDLGYVTPY